MFKDVLLILAVLLVLCFQSCSATNETKSSISLNRSICANTHIGYHYYDYEYRKEMCKSIGDLNIGMIRDYVYNNSKNNTKDRLSVFNNVLFNLHKFAPHTQMLAVLHDRRWDVDKNIPLSEFYKKVREAVITYNGKTRFIPSDYGKEMSFEIKYWEICNELDWFSYGRPPFETIDKVFELIKNAYLTIKDANPNAIVVFPGVANVNNTFIKDILEYKDKDGTRIWDYFDIFNIHCYPPTAEGLIPILNKIKDYKKIFKWNKPIWLTEIGWSEFYTDEAEVAINLPKAYLIAYSYGIEKVFMFQYRRFDYNCSVDASFGLLRSSMDATYISLSSCGKPLSKGKSSEHILINSNKLFFPLKYKSYGKVNRNIAELLLNRLKKGGLKISGHAYMIDSVILRSNHEGFNKDKLIYDVMSSDDIYISHTKFANCSINDTIVISFKDFKKDIKWKNEDNTKSYYALKTFIEKLPDNSSCISLENKDDVYACRWLDNNNNPQMAIWSTKNKKIKIESSSNIGGTDYMGDFILVPSGGLILNNYITYLNGNYQYSLLN